MVALCAIWLIGSTIVDKVRASHEATAQ
jgi:hypothetical protein